MKRQIKLRDECLNGTFFNSIRHARLVLALWRRDHNEVRPHLSLGGRTPASLSLPSCSPVSSPLRAGEEFAGRNGQTALNQTEKKRHDGRDGNRGTYVRTEERSGSGQLRRHYAETKMPFEDAISLAIKSSVIWIRARLRISEWVIM